MRLQVNILALYVAFYAITVCYLPCRAIHSINKISSIPSFLSKLTNKYNKRVLKAFNSQLKSQSGEVYGSLSVHDTDKIIVALIESATQLCATMLFCSTIKWIFKSSLENIGGAINKMSQDKLKINKNYLKYLKANVTLNSYEQELLDELILPESTKNYSSVAGLNEPKATIQSFMIDILTYDMFDIQLKPMQGMLLYGPPGNGKTSLVHATSSSFGLPLITMTPSSIMRKYIGESNQLLKAFFTLAKKLDPCILFIDEIDSLFQSRCADDHPNDRNLKMEFTQLWDDLINSNSKVVVFGATNRPQDIDAAINRRFERSLLLPPPNLHERIDVFKVLLKDVPIVKNFNYLKCAELTDGYMTSDIVAVCKEAIARVQRDWLESRIYDKSISGFDLTKVTQIFNATNNSLIGNFKRRSIKTSDIESALGKIYPTVWSSKVYGGQDNQ